MWSTWIQLPELLKGSMPQYIGGLLHELGCTKGVVCGSRTSVDETTNPPSVVSRVAVVGEYEVRDIVNYVKLVCKVFYTGDRSALDVWRHRRIRNIHRNQKPANTGKRNRWTAELEDSLEHCFQPGLSSIASPELVPEGHKPTPNPPQCSNGCGQPGDTGDGHPLSEKRNGCRKKYP